MQYDVLLPDGKPLADLIPWTAQYNLGGWQALILS